MDSSKGVCEGLGISRGLAKNYPEDSPYDYLRDSSADTEQKSPQTLQTWAVIKQTILNGIRDEKH